MNKRPKRTLCKDDVQMEIADYIVSHLAELEIAPTNKSKLFKGKISAVATIQQPDFEYTGIGEYNVELCFTGNLISPISGSTKVKVSASDDASPLIDVIDRIYIR